MLHEGYYIIHVYNLLQSADLEKSEWVESPFDPGFVMSFDKLVLGNEILNKICLEDRLIFGVKEEKSEQLYHRSVVDHILKLRPTGIAFYPLAEYTGREPFEDESLDYILS